MRFLLQCASQGQIFKRSNVLMFNAYDIKWVENILIRENKIITHLHNLSHPSARYVLRKGTTHFIIITITTASAS